MSENVNCAIGGAGACVDKMPVAEKFLSINGEGLRAGRLAAFLRFRGCNLRCGYCDTVWAQELEGDCSWETIQDLVAYVAGTGAGCVTLTGGEPLMQPLLPQLIEALLAAADEGLLPAGFIIEIETNGSMDLSVLDKLRLGRVGETRARLCFTMDMKCPSSGMSDLMKEENFRFLRHGDVVKMVVGSEDDLQYALGVVRALEALDVDGDQSLDVDGDQPHAQHASHAPYVPHIQRVFRGPQVLLSPVFGAIEPARIVDFMAENGLRDVRLQLQLHKIIWPNVEKGV